MSTPYGAAQQGGLVPPVGIVPNLPYAASAQAEARSSDWQRSGDGNPYLDFFKAIWDSPVGDLAPELLKNTLAGNPTANILAIMKYFTDGDDSDASNPTNVFNSTQNSSTTVENDLGNSGLTSSAVDYFNAEIAKLYGMDRATAYQEALSNTAYQRAVRDMKNAGLNPAVLFGSGRGSSASGVSFIGKNSGSGSGPGEDENLFSDGVYHGIPVIAGIVASIVGKNPKYFLPAQQTATALMGLMDDFSKGQLGFN